MGTSIIFITHDLGVVANIADRVAVMYAGKLVEIGKTEEVFYNPQHPYTKGLLAAMPDLKIDKKNCRQYLVHRRIYCTLQQGMLLQNETNMR